MSLVEILGLGITVLGAIIIVMGACMVKMKNRINKLEEQGIEELTKIYGHLKSINDDFLQSAGTNRDIAKQLVDITRDVIHLQNFVIDSTDPDKTFFKFSDNYLEKLRKEGRIEVNPEEI